MADNDAWELEELTPINNAEVTIADSYFGVGKGWQILENGGRIVKPDTDPAKPVKIHASSRLGKLIARVIKDLKFDMQPRGLPTEAKVWKGLKMHMHFKTFPNFGF